MVAPNALNLKLPGKGNPSRPVVQVRQMSAIERSGVFRLDGRKITSTNLETALRKIIKGK